MAITKENTLIPKIIDFFTRYHAHLVFVVAPDQNEARAIVGARLEEVVDEYPTISLEDLLAGGGIEQLEAMLPDEMVRCKDVLIYGTDPMTLIGFSMAVYAAFNDATSTPPEEFNFMFTAEHVLWLGFDVESRALVFEVMTDPDLDDVLRELF